MPDPIQVEQSFQELMRHYESTISIRHRYRLFRNFVESLEGSFKKYESYILQIVDELSEFTEPLTWTGIDPEQIELDLALLNTLNSFLQLPEKSENFQHVRKRLAEVCLLLYACLNDLRGVNHHLKISFGLPGLKEIDRSKNASLLDQLAGRLLQELQQSTGLSSAKKDQINRILQEIKEIQEEEKWKVLVPVAERYQKKSFENEEYGRLRKIFVDKYSQTEDEDKLAFNMNVYGASNPSLDVKKDLLTASRSLFESTTNNRKENYYRGGVSFEFSNALHDGNSANLAIAAIWYTRLLEDSNHREKYKLRSHSAITGDIDSDGDVLPVDDTVVSLKLRAAFFSWAKILAVPAEQRVLFAEELEKLREKYPNRNLVLIGVSNLRELFFDRRLASHQVEGRFRYYFKKLKRQKYSVYIIPLLIVLLGILAWPRIDPMDQNAVDAEFEDERMTLLNQYGQEIRSLEVGERVVRNLQTVGERHRLNKVGFKDLDNDGINEVFYAKDLNTQNESSWEELVAFSVSGDSIIWEKELRYDLHFPQKPSIGDDGYKIFNIQFLNDDLREKSSMILNIAHERFFPGLLLKIDPQTGEESDRYIHTGLIYQILLYDMNSDGADEIIGLGVNNAFDGATVAFLLDSNDMNGHSPLNEEYKVNEYTKAREIQYIQFPRSIVGDAFRKRVLNNKPYYIEIDGHDKTILIRVYDFIIREPTPFENDSASLFYYFNFNFEIQSIGTDSNYDLWAKNLFEDGLIPFEPDHEYFEAFEDSLLYWRNSEFVQR